MALTRPCHPALGVGAAGLQTRRARACPRFVRGGSGDPPRNHPTPKCSDAVAVRRNPSVSKARLSRVYSSSTVRNFSFRPSSVLSATKSYDQTWFLCWALTRSLLLSIVPKRRLLQGFHGTFRTAHRATGFNSQEQVGGLPGCVEDAARPPLERQQEPRWRSWVNEKACPR